MAKLARMCPTPHVFPRLRTLNINVDPDANGSIAYLTKYFCESLRQVGLTVPLLLGSTPHSSDFGQQLDIPSFVQGVVQNSPNITEIRLFGDGITALDE